MRCHYIITFRGHLSGWFRQYHSTVCAQCSVNHPSAEHTSHSLVEYIASDVLSSCKWAHNENEAHGDANSSQPQYSVQYSQPSFLEPCQPIHLSMADPSSSFCHSRNTHESKGEKTQAGFPMHTVILYTLSALVTQSGNNTNRSIDGCLHTRIPSRR